MKNGEAKESALTEKGIKSADRRGKEIILASAVTFVS